MAADVSVTHRPPLSPEAEAEAETSETADRRAPEQELPPLDPEEIRKRLEHTERQFRNRRKILIRGLPGDVTNQVWGGGAESVAGNTTVRVRRGIPGTTKAAASQGFAQNCILSRVRETLRTRWKGHGQEGQKPKYGPTLLGATTGLGRDQVFEGSG